MLILYWVSIFTSVYFAEETDLSSQCMMTSRSQPPVPSISINNTRRHSDFHLRGPSPSHSEISYMTPRGHVSARSVSNSTTHLQAPARHCWSGYSVLPDVGRQRSACAHDHAPSSVQSASLHLSDSHPRGCKRTRSMSSQSSDFDVVSVARHSPSALRYIPTRGSSSLSSPQPHASHNPFQLGSFGHLSACQFAAPHQQPQQTHNHNMAPPMRNNFFAHNHNNNLQQQHAPSDDDNGAIYRQMRELEQPAAMAGAGMSNMVMTSDAHMFAPPAGAGACAQGMFPQQHTFKQEAFDPAFHQNHVIAPADMSNMMVTTRDMCAHDLDTGQNQQLQVRAQLQQQQLSPYNHQQHSPYDQHMHSPYAAPPAPHPAHFHPHHPQFNPHDLPNPHHLGPPIPEGGEGGMLGDDVIPEEGEEVDSKGEHRCEWVECGQVFAERGELVTHLEKAHIDQRRGEDFTCFWHNCNRQKKPFNARYKLLIHMRVHSGERPNKCTVGTYKSPLKNPIKCFNKNIYIYVLFLLSV